MSKIYFIATKHPQYATDDYPAGSVVIDPWRYVPDQPGVQVRRLGQNKPEMISLLVPSRNRPDQFWEMGSSAIKNATHPRSIEIVCYLDDDDPSKLVYPNNSQTTYVLGPRILLSEMWNECYKHALGDIVMHCGDDIIFRTPGWDTIVRDTFTHSEDKLILVHGDDCSPNTDVLATHGFLHRRWIETVGYFLPPLFSSDWNDVWLTEVADMLGRRIKVPIVTEHMHYSFGKAEYDITHQEREKRGSEDGVVDLYKKTHAERQRDAERLRAAMV